ncbi:MAG: transporter [Myxococcota bacterium]
MKRVILGLAAFLAASSASAALAAGVDSGAPMVTDRPNVAESSLVVPLQRFQLETGIEFFDNDIGEFAEVNGFRFPTKLRYGIAEDYELHVEGTVFNRLSFDPGDRGEGGLANIDIGGKANFLDQDGQGTPSLGLLVALTLPVGDGDVAPDQTVLRPLLLADWDLVSALSLSTNLGFLFPLNDRDFTSDFFTFAGSLGIHPDTLPSGLGFFVELFGFVDLDGDDDAIGIDFGATYLVNNDFQLDAYLRFGLSDDADDVVGGGGASFLF